MVCPVCPTAGWFGGYVGGFFGINAPKQVKERVFSAFITASMICISMVALKTFCGISFCDGNGDFTFRNITQAGGLALLMGIVYSMVVNFLLQQFACNDQPSPPPPPPKPEEVIPPCCCSGAIKV